MIRNDFPNCDKGLVLVITYLLIPIYAGTMWAIGFPRTDVRSNNLGQLNDQRAPEIRFTKAQMGDGLSPEGARIYFTKYESSSKNSLYQTWIYFGSPAEAEKKLAILATNVLTTISKSPESNKDGQQVGERILVLCREKTQGETQAVLAWTSGSTYQEIRSAFFDDVLAFGKQLKAK